MFIQKRCAECGDVFTVYDCPLCGQYVRDNCPECHAELVHGVISSPTGLAAVSPDGLDLLRQPVEDSLSDDVIRLTLDLHRRVVAHA